MLIVISIFTGDSYDTPFKNAKKILNEQETDVNKIAKDMYDNLEDEYGKGVKFSYKVTDKKKLNKDKREAISDAYSSFADVSSGVSDAIGEHSELSDKDIDKLQKTADQFMKKLEKFKVKSGYHLDVDVTVQGKDDDNTEDIDVVIIKVEGEWMIDYLTTAMINDSDYDIDEVDDCIDDMDIDDLNDELKSLDEELEYVEEYLDADDIIEYLLENILSEL